MKTKILYSALFFSFVFLYCNAQTAITIYTPQGSPVQAYYQIPEMSQQDKEVLSDSVANNYPLATELNVPSATTSYNCHGYAWHVSEGGIK